MTLSWANVGNGGGGPVRVVTLEWPRETSGAGELAALVVRVCVWSGLW